MRIVQRAIQAGAEVIILGDDYAGNHGPMMSPALFRQFILPPLAKMIAMIHEEGASCIKHSDGDLYPILDDIVSAGPDGINPIEPVAGMELKKVKQLVGDKVCLTGNIDCATSCRMVRRSKCARPCVKPSPTLRPAAVTS